MKKWAGVLAVITLIILLGMSFLVGKETANKASYGTLQKNQDYISQIIQSDDMSFVIYQNISDGKYRIEKINKNLNQFQTVGTAHSRDVYVIFGYVENQKQYWGIEPLIHNEETEWKIPVFQADGSFLGAGSFETEIYISFLGEDQKTVTEYVISLNTVEPTWTERKDFRLTDEQKIRFAGYMDNVFMFQQENGKIFSCDVIVKEVEVADAESFLSSNDKNLMYGAEGTWSIYVMFLSMDECVLPALIVSLLVVFFLYGCSKKEAIIYRILCFTEVISCLCFIVTAYISAIGIIKTDVFTIDEKTEIILFIKTVVYILCSIVSLVHVIIALVLSIRWKKFTKAIEYIAKEKKAYTNIPKKNDGMQMFWMPLETIGNSIAKAEYLKEQLYKSYFRFVPKGMETLLQKGEMSELSIGDYNSIYGCMVNVSIQNIKNYDVSDYMSVMTNSLQIMHKVRGQYGGIYHSSGADLLDRKIFFQNNPEKALPFAIELIQAFKKNGYLKGIDYSFMLHLSDYYYGISGVDDMMTPFIYCQEEKILEPYVKVLSKAKVKIALTERTLELIGDAYSVRYIGFIANKNLGDIKIYECIDAYDEKKRNQMNMTNDIFQNALQLFYTNDFYLARNSFNEVLKHNEQDQIARWYLFHCEYHLNNPDAEISYGLFENMNNDMISF